MRLFNGVATNVEPYFECSNAGELARLAQARVCGVTNREAIKSMLAAQTLLTIDAHSDGLQT
jgi:hypothetical protein